MSELAPLVAPKETTILPPNTKYQCKDCKFMFFKTKDNMFTCPKCGSPNVLLMIMD